MRKTNQFGACAALLALLYSSAVNAQPELNQPAPAEPSANPAARLKAVVERVSDTVFILEPDTFEALLADPAWLGRQARVVPHYVDGEPLGFKMFGIRKGSLWALMGLLNGDTVRAVNGLELSSPQAALEIYSQVKGASFVVDLVRKGELRRHTYNLRGEPEAIAPPPIAATPGSVAPASQAPASQAPAPYQGGGRLRAHVSLDFGETPGDVSGTLRVMTDAPVVWTAMTGGQHPGMPRIDFGRGELVIRVSPGAEAPTVKIVTLQLASGDLAVQTDPASTIELRPGAGLAGARLSVRMRLTPGAKATGAIRDLLSADKDMAIACTGPLLSPRCRLEGSR